MVDALSSIITGRWRLALEIPVTRRVYDDGEVENVVRLSVGYVHRLGLG